MRSTDSWVPGHQDSPVVLTGIARDLWHKAEVAHQRAASRGFRHSPRPGSDRSFAAGISLLSGIK